MIPVRRSEIAAGLGLGLLFLMLLLVYGPFDQEETALGIFASQVHYQHLLRGEWLFWLNDLGFGTPLPIGHRLDFHPVFALSAIAPLRAALSALWLAQMAAAVVYFLRLAAVSGIRPPLRLFLLACYVFSAVSVCWFYENDWVTFVIGWSIYPVLVFYLRQAVLGEAETHFWLASIRLALLFGFLILNSHPGYVAPLVIILVVYTLVAAPRRLTVYGCLLAGFILCVAITAERLYFFTSEMLLFPSGSRYSQPEYQIVEYVRAALAPLIPADGAMRLPFIGLVLGAAALASIAFPRKSDDAPLWACRVAFITALLLSVTPPRLLLAASSGGWLFRDPMVFFGILAGGLLLQRGVDSPQPWLRGLTWTLLAVQVGQQAGAILPGFRQYYDRREVLQFYRYQGQPAGLGQMLVQGAARFGPRIYLSGQAQRLARAFLSAYGIHVITDLVFLGLNPVNAWFKVISMDRLYPSIGFMHGHIGGEESTIENSTLLDVLGINMVLTTEGDGPVPAGLSVLDRLPVSTLEGAHVLVVLGNPDAWPKAVLLAPAARALVLPHQPGCPNDRALCQDFRELAALRLPDPVSMKEDNGRYTVHVEPKPEERLLFLSSFYRPEWKATSPAGDLPVAPVAGAFIGVTLPPGTTDVQLTFAPTVRIVLTWLSGLVIWALILCFAALSWRNKRPAATEGAHGLASA